ncbi:S-layer family protein [Aneurinibacillus soli]|uniref:Uncharacterized protein n=1 Tax=Aneurinibacillus soli TaxID=1500254 RepID=A0A0U5C7H0_9BACL|nr:S-layer homology domain-containing protein [Aneurinibacillus soli]PYE64214.1 S-layer family protein [Aneurinibacillus soli]BAU28163.1 hypothetical protein CB4_02337 [Aneurinibacillus soli]
MSQIRPFDNANESHKRKLFYATGVAGAEWSEVPARIIEPYQPPTPSLRVKENKIINAPSDLTGSTTASYRTKMRLLFQTRQDLSSYLIYINFPHKFYDERGAIYIGSVDDHVPSVYEALQRYIVEISIIMTRKDQYDKKYDNPFIDTDPNAWYYQDMLELIDMGVIAGKTDTTFQPNGYVTRAEFTALLNRMRRFVELTIRT